MPEINPWLDLFLFPFALIIRLPKIFIGCKVVLPRGSSKEAFYPQEAWDNIDQETINDFIDSMPDRLKAVVELEWKMTGL